MSKKRKKSYQAILERKGIYSIDEIKDITKAHLFYPINEKVKVELDGDLIKANSQRYQTFFTKGTKCVCCGIEGKYFAKEKGNNDKNYHLNLYAINDAGEEILMTKDHIIPKIQRW